MSKVTLYHWNQCGHCVAFKPQWEVMKNQVFEPNQVQATDFEYNSNPKAIEDAGINAFPTVVVERNGDRYILEGPTVDEVVSAVLPDGPPQSGGGSLDAKVKSAMKKVVRKLKMEYEQLKSN